MSSSQTTGAGGLSPWKWLLLPGMAAMIGLGYLWAGDIATFVSPKTTRIIFWHVPMAILSMVWFFISAFYSIRVLRGKDAFDDERASKAAEIGLLLTVLATLTGMVFSKMQWAGGASAWYEGYWQWDPKQTGIVIVIVIFMAYFGLRMSVEDPGKRSRLAAVYAILAATAVPFINFLLPHLPIFGQTMHPSTTIREGMDVPYRVTFWFGNLLFMGYTIWGYQLQLRAARLAERGAMQVEGAEPRFEAVRTRPAEQQ